MSHPRRTPALRVPRLAPLAVAAASLLAHVGPADAAGRSARLVTLLARSTGAHPLAADDGRVALLFRMPPGADASSRGLLPVAPGLGAIHLLPAEVDGFVARHPDLGVEIAPARQPLLDVSGTWTGAPAFRAETGLDGTGVVVGIIDTGLDVAHRDFRDAWGKSRVAWLMEREQPRGYHPELEEQYGCTSPAQSPCAIYSAADIDLLLASSPSIAPRDASGHGTHVASIAAGNGGVSVTSSPRYVGVAPGATIIVASPSSSGFSDPDILNGARFIFDRAEELGLPAVVNVSLGSDYGPHDGTSLLEQGLAAMVGDDEPGRVMVTAVGNSGARYAWGGDGPFGVHTEAHCSPNALTRVPMTIPGLSGTVKGAGFVWITFRPADEVSVGLEGPDAAGWIGLTASGDERGYEDDQVSAAVINDHLGPNAPITADSNSAVVSWSGEWQADGDVTILLRGHGDAQLWVTGTGGAAAGTSLGLMFRRALLAGTVAVPASHPDLLAVGCTLNRTHWRPDGTLQQVVLGSFGGVADPEPDSVCYFSAAGPTATGALKPELLAPGAMVAGAMSQDADPRLTGGGIFAEPGCPPGMESCHVVDATHAITSGTSMAAPQVAGAAALLLQADPTLTERRVTDLLQAGAARPRAWAPYDFQQGPGELSLPGALQALAESPPEPPEPVAAASWFVLGTPYARPDPSWPVEGVVELRLGDGNVPASVPKGALTLHVGGGLVLAPLARVRAGLYRFAVAAREATGGTTMTVDVRYRGVSLGARTLPIAVDGWAAGGGVQAVGGCAIASPSRSSGDGVAALLGAALLVATRRRARRARGARGR